MLVDVPVGGRHRGGCALKQGESERLEEEYDRQLAEQLGQEEEEEGDHYHPTTTRRHARHGGRRRQWFRAAWKAWWYFRLEAEPGAAATTSCWLPEARGRPLTRVATTRLAVSSSTDSPPSPLKEDHRSTIRKTQRIHRLCGILGLRIERV